VWNDYTEKTVHRYAHEYLVGQHDYTFKKLKD
jgi:hypothetical protein